MILRGRTRTASCRCDADSFLKRGDEWARNFAAAGVAGTHQCGQDAFHPCEISQLTGFFAPLGPVRLREQPFALIEPDGFRPAADCKPGEVCAVSAVQRTYKTIFWVVAALIVLALAFPYVLPLFY